MKNFILTIPLLMLAGCPDPGGDFVGTYKTSLTVSGPTLNESVSETLAISEGQTADLILTSQNLGGMKATIIGNTSFEIDQQQIQLTNSAGQQVSVTVMGQGTVNDGVLAASGQISGNAGTLSLMMNGSRQ